MWWVMVGEIWHSQKNDLRHHFTFTETWPKDTTSTFQVRSTLDYLDHTLSCLSVTVIQTSVVDTNEFQRLDLWVSFPKNRRMSLLCIPSFFRQQVRVSMGLIAVVYWTCLPNSPEFLIKIATLPLSSLTHITVGLNTDPKSRSSVAPQI